MKVKQIHYMQQLIKKITLILSSSLILLFNTIPAHADDSLTAPTPPSAPSAPTAPSAPPTTSSSTPTANTSPVPTTTTQPNTTTSPTPTPQSTSQNTTSQSTPQQNDPTWDPTVTTTPTPTPSNSQTTTTTQTTATSPSADPSNSGNGADSSNSSSTNTTQTTSAIQTNTTSSAQTLTQGSTTGTNNTSENVGDTNTTTGDANVSGTIITAQNTNVDGVAVSEFNIADNHTGDIVLDFGSNCISGCATTVPGEIVKNINNGAGSTNTATASSAITSSTSQDNTASSGNNLQLTADSGNNLSNRNTDGNTTITTGDANVSANSLTFLNNNITGNVVYGVVNIYGDLQGDIILPQSALDNFAPCINGCSNSTNIGNGVGSANTSSTNATNNSFLSQTNDAVIDNSLQLASTTGGNQATRNTGGTTAISSGQSSATSHVLNIANSNISSGNYWLVLINNAGQWIGKLLGAPDGATSVSNGLTITSDAQGNVSASNNGNGADSTNNAQANQNAQSSTAQQNTAKVGNNLTLAANTGGNTANENTGGDVTVQTGNAKILANIVNFVNNNIVGTGKLFVTIVNVFGKWVGDFVTPGQQKENSSTVPNTTSSQTNMDNQQQTPQTSVPTSITSQNAPETSQLENPIVRTQNGSSSQGVLGTVSTAFQNGQKTTVAALHSSPLRKVLTINLAWLLLAIIPLSASLFFVKTARKK